MQRQSEHVPHQRRANLALILIGAGLMVSSARAGTDVKVAWPERFRSGTAVYAVVRDGKIIQRGEADISQGRSTTLPIDLGDRAAALFITLNPPGDKLLSHYPSFEDMYVQKEIQADMKPAQLRVTRSDWRDRRPRDSDKTLTVHYHRYENDYRNVGLWTWDEKLQHMPKNQEVFAVGHDDYGLVFQVDPSLYGSGDGKVGLLPRMEQNWSLKDGGDRFWTPSMGDEVWLLQGSSEVYTSVPSTRPRLVGASIESPNEILIRFSRAVPFKDLGSCQLHFTSAGGQQMGAREGKIMPPGRRKSPSFRVKFKETMDFVKNSYVLELGGFEPVPVTLGGLLTDRGRFYDGDARLGAHYTPEGTTFRVFAPTAESVAVVVATKPRGGGVTGAYPMKREAHGIWSLVARGNLKDQFYSYRLKGRGFDQREEVTDPYSVCNSGPGGRGQIVDLDATDPPGFDPSQYVKLASPVDAIIYEMHIRDFSIAANSGIEHKGKFLGVTEGGTRLVGDGSIKTGIDHLVELGVTHVQIMPIEDFDNGETEHDPYNWGYMPMWFNSPDGWYATVPVGTARITEFKRVVQALHERGIGVIMDVVYNHTGAQAPFDKLVPGYYYRRRRDGSYYNGSGCGNEFASEHPMARKFMIDSVTYWMREYGVDGFRFDLMGLHDLETMKAIHRALLKINPSALVYGEPWAGGEAGIPITDKSRIAGTGVLAFNDHVRDAIKGGRDGGPPGFIQAGADIGRIRQGILGGISDWARQPTDCVTYAACHDNLTVYDKLLQSVPKAPQEMKERMQRFAGLLVLTSQGMPFVHSGQEMCRSKKGSHNSYNLPDAVNQIDWSWKKKHRSVFDYYRGLIALRKQDAGMRLRTADQIRKRVRFKDHVPTSRTLAYTIDGRGLPGEAGGQTMILLNGDQRDQAFPLPAGHWRVVADDERAGTETLREVQGEVTITAHSGMVLLQH